MAQISHRDRLIEGALACLQDHGYARTTARDIAAAADANLASIGYHFGSKEALLNEALQRAFEEWTRRIGELALGAEGASPLERLAISWKATLESFDQHGPLLVAFVDAMAQAAHSPELRDQLARHYQSIRLEVAQMIRASIGEDAERLGADPQVIASFLIAVCDGLVLQWLLDPGNTPGGEELVTSLGSALALALGANPEDAGAAS